MKTDTTKTLSTYLHWILLGVFFLCLLAMPLLPVLLATRFNAGWTVITDAGAPISYFPLDQSTWPLFFLRLGFLELFAAGAAFVLWQGRGVMKNLARFRLFVSENVRHVRAAGFCTLGLAGVALVRMLTEWAVYGFRTVLYAYNTLFIPVFLVGGLLMLVLAALFEQGLKLKEDNDLVI